MSICVCTTIYFSTTTSADGFINLSEMNGSVVQWSFINPERYTVNMDLIPHRAYFDSRIQNSHDNATVVSVSVLSKYRRRIIGCEADGVVNRNPAIENIILQTWIDRFRPVSHVDCFVYCYDMSVKAGSVVHVLYNKSGTIVRVPAMAAIVIPNYSKEEYSVMVCATGFGKVAYVLRPVAYLPENNRSSVYSHQR